MMELKTYLKDVMKGENLNYEDAAYLATELMAKELNPIQVAGLLTALKTKGETYEEISGFAMGLKNNAITIQSKRKDFYDIVGTGGDGADTFNISTSCAFVLSGAGVNIAKHGNRSISSKCGSADVLEALGVNIQASSELITRQLDEVGLSFIFAPLAHPSMKNVMTVRKSLGVATIFNIVGPLSNPLDLSGQFIGVFKAELVAIMAKSLLQLGIKKGAVVHGAGGLDEASLMGKNTLALIKNGKLEMMTVDGRDYGLSYATLDDLKGGNAEENASILKDILKGIKGPKRDVVLLNTAIALYAFDKAKSIDEGIALAAKSIDSGAALKQLDKLVELSS